jgi:GNAT superfamily N-acetyltransferase
MVVADVREIAPEDTWPLRRMVLRQGMPEESCIFPGDALNSSGHLGLHVSGHCVGVVSLMHSPMPDTTDVPPTLQWQLRGMAVAPDMRGKGLGLRLLRSACGWVAQRGGRLLWCNARETALGFYRRGGFVSVGEPFVIAPIGVHVRMKLLLEDQTISEIP